VESVFTTRESGMQETEMIVVAAPRAGATKEPGAKRKIMTIAIVAAVTALRSLLIRACQRRFD
jgi:hypothetical protein